MSVHAHRIRIERQLGDPSDPSEILSFARSVENDESEHFPTEQIERVHALGLGPIADGELWQFEEILERTIAISSRDLTVSVAVGVSLLGALPVLLAGNQEQIAALTRSARAGKHNCLALTEKSHGSDLASTNVAARVVGEDYVLAGTKWLIGNGTRASNLTVLVRVLDKAKSATAVLFIDRERISAGGISAHPKIKTHGIRGADISGFTFKDCRLPKSTTVGKVGGGFELIGKSLQISRILCCGFSLGASETALRTTYEFASSRNLYGRGMLAMSVVRSDLVTAFVQSLINEAVTRVAHRCLHTHAEALALISAVSKVFVPQNADDLIRRCSRLLGARHYLREEHDFGVFQKLKRDHEVVGLFDGSTAVNQNIIASHLPALALDRAQGHEACDSSKNDHARRLLFDLDSRLPATEFPSARLLMLSTASDPCIVPGSIALREIDTLIDDRGGSEIKSSFHRIIERVQSLDEKVLAHRRAGELDPRSSLMFGLADEYCRLFAAITCVRTWAAAVPGTNLLLTRPEWVKAALAHLLGDGATRESKVEEYLLNSLAKLATRNLPLSLMTPV